MKIVSKKISFLLIIALLFIIFFAIKSVQAQTPPTACYSGSWVQPTCNPNTSDPNNCNILPPLFSGANCGQHTGYLRIQNESAPENQRFWIVLDGAKGQIKVGDTLGAWVYNTVQDPGVFAKGPITSGQFDSWPAVGPGGIVAQNSLRSQGTLYVGTNTFTSGYISASGAVKINANPVSVGGSPTATLYVENPGANANTIIYVRQNSLATGRMLDMYSGDNNNIYFDNLGYLNATKDFQIRIDVDSNGTNEFRINDGGNTPVFRVNESGDTTVTRTLTAGTVVANSGGVGNGTIRGNFVESTTGNVCNADQLLVYRGAPFTPGWYCVSATNVGTTTVGNLLQTLQAGADASSFTGTPKIGHGSGAGGVFITGNQTAPTTLTLQYINGTQSSVNDLIGRIGFATQYNDLDEAKIEVSRGASGGGGNYPTNMSFWTTPVGSSIAQERLTILHNGNVGISNTSPTARLNINVPVNTEGIRLINNNYSPLVIRNNADAIDIFRVNQSGNVTALGNLGLGGISNPGYSIHVNKTVGQASLALETTAVGNGASIELRNSDATQIPFIDLTKGWTSGNTPDYSGRIAYWSDNDFRIIQATNNPLSFWTNDTKRMTINGSGRVGIGTDSPSALLHLVNTSASTDIRLEGNGSSSRYPNLSFYNGSTKVAQIISDVAQGSYLLDYSSSYGGTFRIRSTPDNNAATVLLINTAGNVGINNTSPSTKLDVTGTVRGTFVGSSGALCANGQVLVFDGTNWNCGTVTGSDNLGNHTATQNLNMSGYQIVNAATGTFTVVSANKITVNTIDPVYTIQGEKYATYVPAMTGVKEETTGLLQLKLDKASGLVSGEIDFTLLAKGSDLWIFAQTINYQKNFEQIVILMTPAFDGRVWYEKDITKKTLKIFGKPLNNLAKEYEVSYRLTGPRFDYQQWPNITDEETEGLNIDKFLQNN